MNRRQKIIVSVTGIFLVLLLLVGLTYAYFLTQITGNTNDKSISVSTANLALVYGDDDGSVIGEGETIIPGKTFEPKTFTVTNNGNDTTDYVVVIEVLEGTSTFESNDFTYTLTCESGCNGVDVATTFPINGGILVGNNIDVDEVQTYSLTLTYEETGKNQTNDMNKTLNARINIKDISSINPYESNKNSLAYNIINNTITGKTSTTLMATPLTKVAEEISGEFATVVGTGEIQELDMSSQTDWIYASTYEGAQPWNGGNMEGNASECNDTIVGKFISYPTHNESWFVKSCKSSTVAITEDVASINLDYENVLSVTEDDYGVSYYYRGNVEDNYITFANMCWRIVRIAGDGSVKLILEDQDQVCSPSINGNWAIPTTTDGSTYSGIFGYREYSPGELIASDGISNTITKYVMDYLYGTTTSAAPMATVFKNFQNTFTQEELSKLKSGDWCFADNGYDERNNALTATQMLDNKVRGIRINYDSYVKLAGTIGGFDKYLPTLKCNGTVMNDWGDTNKTPMYVGTITANEIVYAGGKYETSNKNYYLINEEFKKSTTGENKVYGFVSFSPAYFFGDSDRIFTVDYSGSLHPAANNALNASGGFRPSISLASSTSISKGDGTISNPYVVE